MNFNFENPYIENDSEDLPYNLYEIYGVNKIKELSGQLRVFLSLKAATIQYRFSSKDNLYLNDNDKRYKVSKRNFKTLGSKFLKLLINVRKSSKSYEVELEQLIKNLLLTGDKVSKGLIAELKKTTEELFTSTNKLSEQDIHLHPKLLRFILKLTQEMCLVNQVLNNWASKFYQELRLNYVQLHNELSLLIPEENSEKIATKKKELLKEGLKEW